MLRVFKNLLAQYFNSCSDIFNAINSFKIMKVNFNPVVDKRIEKVIPIEAFESDNSIKAAEKENNNKLHDKHDICRV